MSSQPEHQSELGDEINVSAKKIVLNTFDVAGEDINRKKAWEALREAGIIDTGYEYFRRTYKEAIDGDHDIDAVTDEQVQSVLVPVLSQTGVLDSADEVKTKSKVQSTTGEQSDSHTSNANDSLLVDDLLELRDRIDLLRRQADFESRAENTPDYRKAQFIAQEALDGIDEMINKTK